MLAAFLMPVLAGVMLGCSFLPAPAHWLAWVSLVPIAGTIARRDHRVASYIGMYFGGLVFNLITTDWVRTLEGGSGLSGNSAPDWLLQAQMLALFWPLTLLLGRLLVANWALPMSVVLPFVWVIHELMLRTLWGIVDGTGWQIYFLGYAIVEHHYVAQIADLSGVSTLSLVTACVNGALWDLLSLLGRPASVELARFRHPPRSVAVSGALAAAALLIVSCGYGAWAVHQSQYTAGPRVWLMPESLLREPPTAPPWQPDLPHAPDILLWSELAYHGPPVDATRPQPATIPEPGSKGDSERALEDLCRRFGMPLVVGYTRHEKGRTGHNKYNSAAFVDPRGGLQGCYDKIGLVPWTEFTPWQGLSRRTGSNFCHGTDCPVFELGDKNRHRFATAICFDVAFPQLFRRIMRTPEGPPDFFLVCSSERSDTTGQMSRHVLTLSKVRAIECRRSLVRNVHEGRSGRIDSTGRLLDASIALRVASPTPLDEIPIDSRTTLYLRWGDWIAALAVAGVMLTAIWQAFRAAAARGPARQREVQYSTAS